MVILIPAKGPDDLSTRRFLLTVGLWDGSQLSFKSVAPPITIRLRSASEYLVCPLLPKSRALIASYKPIAPFLEGMEFVAYLTMAEFPDGVLPIPTATSETAQ